MKTSCNCADSFVSSGVLFCVGGRGGSGDPFRSIECYSITKNSWFFGPEMNSRRRHVGVISVEGKRNIYLVFLVNIKIKDYFYIVVFWMLL